MMFNVHLAEDGAAFKALASELRTRSQQERKNVFWAVSLNDAIDRETVELFRSKEMLARKEREAKTADETALIGEEKLRLRRHQDELRRLLRAACLAGSVSFRGNDRSPDDRAVDMGKSAADILSDVLPEVFDRFKEAAARSSDLKKGVDALFTARIFRASLRCLVALGSYATKGVRLSFASRVALWRKCSLGLRNAPIMATQLAEDFSPMSSRRNRSVGTSKLFVYSFSRCCVPAKFKRLARVRQ